MEYDEVKDDYLKSSIDHQSTNYLPTPAKSTNQPTNQPMKHRPLLHCHVNQQLMKPLIIFLFSVLGLNNQVQTSIS